MTIKRCDRCGKAYNVCADYGIKFGKQSSSGLDTIRDPKSSFSSYDLCENCTYAFMKWFNKPSYRKDVRVVKRNNGFFNFEQKPKEETT